jgi:hypothetical protein
MGMLDGRGLLPPSAPASLLLQLLG